MRVISRKIGVHLGSAIVAQVSNLLYRGFPNPPILRLPHARRLGKIQRHKLNLRLDRYTGHNVVGTDKMHSERFELGSFPLPPWVVLTILA